MEANQKGYSALWLVCFLIIISLFVGVAWRTWQVRGTNNTSTTAKPKQLVQNTEYLEIASEGIKLKLSDPILDAYSVTSHGGVAFNLASLDGIAGCKPHDTNASDGPVATGLAVLSFDKYDNRSDQTPEASGFKGRDHAVRVGNNWYEIQVDNNECKSNNAAIQAKIDTAKNAIREASKTIVKL